MSSHLIFFYVYICIRSSYCVLTTLEGRLLLSSKDKYKVQYFKLDSQSYPLSYTILSNFTALHIYLPKNLTTTFFIILVGKHASSREWLKCNKMLRGKTYLLNWCKHYDYMPYTDVGLFLELCFSLCPLIIPDGLEQETFNDFLLSALALHCSVIIHFTISGALLQHNSLGFNSQMCLKIT